MIRSRALHRPSALVVLAAALVAAPSAGAAVTAVVTGNVLTVSADAADAVTIACAATNVQVNAADPEPGGDALRVDSARSSSTAARAATPSASERSTRTDFPSVTSVIVRGEGGNDTITGSALADRLDGGSGAFDVVDGGAGDDTLLGGDGFDTVTGGAGSDRLEGGPAPTRTCSRRRQRQRPTRSSSCRAAAATGSISAWGQST